MPISKEEIEAAAIKAEVEAKIRRSGNFQRLFKGEAGDYVLDEIEKFTHFKGNTFHRDPYEHAYREGQRSMAVFLHNILDQDVESAKKILREKKK